MSVKRVLALFSIMSCASGYALETSACENYVKSAVSISSIQKISDELQLLGMIKCESLLISSGQKEAALFKAVDLKSLAALNGIIEAGVDVEVHDARGITPTMLAAQKGNDSIFLKLISSGGKITRRAPNGYAAFDFALELGHLNILELVIDAYMTNHRRDLGAGYERLELAKAIIKGNLSKVEELQLAGADINLHNESNYAPLPLAVRLGHVAIVRFLLSNGANPNIGNDGNDEAIPLNQAARSNNVEMAKLLLANGANINKENGRGYSALMLASMYGHEKMTTFLLEQGAKVSHLNHKGSDALMLAAAYGHANIAKLLLTEGAQFSLQNNQGFTAVDYAFQQGHKQIIALFLEHSGNRLIVNLMNSESHTLLNLTASNIDTLYLGYPPLTYAARFGNSGLVRALLNAGADPSVKSLSGYQLNALMAVGQGGDFSILESILESDIDVNAVDGHGDPAINWATAYGRKDFVEKLLSAGANPLIENKDGYSAIKTAEERGLNEILAMLKAQVDTKSEKRKG